MAQKFNEAVATDLKAWRDCYLLVLVDKATRFCAATVIRNKCASTIVNGLFKCWISVIGQPLKFLPDNGREYNNADMRELGEKFNIKIMTTSAASAWSNGICERLNGVLAGIVDKIIADCSCDVGDVLKLNKVIHRLTADNMRLYFPQMSPLEECQLECFSDAAFANLSDNGSQGAFIIFLRDKKGLRYPLYWKSRKIRRVVKSTLAAETLALVDGTEACVFTKHVLNEILGCCDLPVACYVDNKSLVDALNSTKSVDDRRLRTDISLLKDMLKRKEINSISWVNASSQLANCLTKKGANYEQLRSAISVNESH